MKGIIINELGNLYNELKSTAIDDFSTRNVEEEEMILHMFQHKGINMGLDDTKLEKFDQGLLYYEKMGESVVIRNSGGRSIVADEGVLSMSLVFRSKKSMHDNYDYYGQFIIDALRPLTQDIKVGEIKGACCPGKTDMSINGRKFCGTAQKKIKDSVALVCYISVNGDQLRRNRLVKGFYDACETDEVIIDLDAMDSLSNLIGYEVSIDQIAKLLEAELARRTLDIVYRNDTELKNGFNRSLEHTTRQNNRYLNNK